MHVSAARVSRLLCVLVLAFAPYESRPLLGAGQLLRGMAIEVAYRWPTGRIVADPEDRAVLLWSRASRTTGGVGVASEFLGVVVATVVGAVLVFVGYGLVLLPIGVVMVALGVDVEVVIDGTLAIVALSLVLTCWRAISAYRAEEALGARLRPTVGQRWRVDFLAAIPPGQGCGGRLLDEFLDRADDAGAEVVLHCERRNVSFYRRHGFRLVDAVPAGSQQVMVRPVEVRRDGTTRRAARS